MDAPPVAYIRDLIASCPMSELPALIQTHAEDPRAGVIDAIARAQRQLQRYTVERARLEALARAEWDLADAGLLLVAGVDEVGRGALAGPVTAGACVFDRDAMLEGLDDSKRLSPAARVRLHGIIAESALAVSVAHADPAEIDAVGIGQATTLAMRRAIAALGVVVDHVLVDGRPVDLGVASTAFVRGDSTVRAIAAAAVYAKVTRDALMVELDSEYPGYGLAGNKGYGSTDHLLAISLLGPSPIHRRSFSPCTQRTLF